MAFTLKLTGDYLLPAISCDCCGGAVTSSGFHLSRLTPDRAYAVDHPTAQVCSEACYEDFVSTQPLDDEWFAIPIDAYLANLVLALDIDVEDVLERERAVSAAEHTRHEAPD
ncbi:MAG TPA: hypothetical protein VHV31_13715 [Nitrolancea sp.]|nr:hypothetical protein [Nitrolancea sp.]